MSDLCYTTLQLPAPPHQPQVRVYRVGPKDEAAAPGYNGEVLYNAGDVAPHIALMLTEKVARNALADRIPSSGLSVGKPGGYDDGKEDEPEAPQPDIPPPRPEFQWNGPDGDMPRIQHAGGQSRSFHRGAHQIGAR